MKQETKDFWSLMLTIFGIISGVMILVVGAVYHQSFVMLAGFIILITAILFNIEQY